MNTILNPDTFPYVLAIIFFAIAVLWAIPTNCNDVPGPVLFVSRFVKRLTRFVFLSLLYALLVVTAVGCVAAFAFAAACLAPIAILVWLLVGKK